MRFASPRLIWINFAHLFLVSLLPFATAWMARTDLAPAPVATYAGLFVLVNGAYLLFEREVFAQADACSVSKHARRMARRRTLAGVAVFALAAPALPLLGFFLICCALALYLRPEAFGGAGH